MFVNGPQRLIRSGYYSKLHLRAQGRHLRTGGKVGVNGGRGNGRPPYMGRKNAGRSFPPWDRRDWRVAYVSTEAGGDPGSVRLEQDSAEVARFVSYNVLSSSLSSAPDYPDNTKESLHPENRLKRLLVKLEREVAAQSIISLQEVSLKWSGPLHTFFARNDYHFIFTGYGGSFNGYMGIGTAIPNRLYEVVEVNVNRLADLKSWPRPVVPEKTEMQKWLDGIMKSPLWRALVSDADDRRPQDDGYSYSRRRFNNIIFMRLRAKSTDKVFCVANYHMPCAYFLPAAMTIHSALAVQHAQQLSGSDPLVFCGDFNFKPDSSCYKLITEGALPEDDPDAHPVIPENDPWRPTVPKPMRSAYREFTGEEPDFTNFAKRKDVPVFVHTLDYIFITPDLEVVDVEALPARDDIAGPLPNDDEPSDHILIAATLRMSTGSEPPKSQLSDGLAEPSLYGPEVVTVKDSG